LSLRRYAGRLSPAEAKQGAKGRINGTKIRPLPNYTDLNIEKGPETPSGVYARTVEGRTLYVNTTGEEKSVPIRGNKHGVISGRSYPNLMRLKPYDADLVE
jgi:beta-galactosidase